MIMEEIDDISRFDLVEGEVRDSRDISDSKSALFETAVWHASAVSGERQASKGRAEGRVLQSWGPQPPGLAHVRRQIAGSAWVSATVIREIRES